jgi:flagellar basal body-associated protein FliL
MQKKYWLILIILFVILGAIMIIFFSFTKPEQKVEKKLQLSPSPSYLQPTKHRLSSTPTPSLIEPNAFTGVLEDTLPKEIQDLSDQKQTLKKMTPLSQPLFMISFDYSEDKFIVNLNEPKNESQISFYDWKNTNYPNIPNDRFIVK